MAPRTVVFPGREPAMVAVEVVLHAAGLAPPDEMAEIGQIRISPAGAAAR